LSYSKRGNGNPVSRQTTDTSFAYQARGLKGIQGLDLHIIGEMESEGRRKREKPEVLLVGVKGTEGEALE